MRWVVTGATGLLGAEVVALLRARGDDVRALGRADLDVRDAAAVRAALAGAGAVVNCAAVTDVDGAEHAEAAAAEVNVTGARNVARAAADQGARTVHVSTDYVFGARPQTVPYAEDADLAPLGAYGRTKAAGEEAVLAADEDALVVRTAWLYGAAGPCFPRSILRAARARETLDVVDDQTGQPTWARDVADVLLRLVDEEAPAGRFHATSTGATTWCGFAREVLVAAGLDPARVRPTTTVALGRPALRPTFSVLGNDRLLRAGVRPVGAWADRWVVAAPEMVAAAAAR